ncbi:uncharacterized protein LOC131947820 [Physella acuta]|uniref:uncharacterized protein LOC131947820 n=1 Tax=Physella acuta TaxID=109671 RepID=UPI0027DDEAD4|nr:uncharacterized protein LOC131947820 [Physella acuta]
MDLHKERTTYEAAGTMMCRCQTWECDGAGGCLGESPDCQRHWFGEGCQYRNLGEYADVDTVLLDGDSYTCYEYRGVFDINLSVKIYFTWMRIVTTSRDLTKKNYTLVLTNREVGSEPQDNHPRFNVTGGTIDVQGTTAAYIDGISLTVGDRLEVCELYIGGGRNVAFAQPTEDSKISNDTSFLAVDGHDQRTSDCYRGQLNSEQFWLVDFRSPCIVHEIVIKRRFVSSKDYSHMFGTVIHLYNVSGEPVVLERQFDDSISSIVRIFTKITFPITRIKLTLTSSNTRTYLEICELEAYGECEPQPKTTSSIIQSSSNPNVSSHLLESNFSASPISDDVELPLGRRDYPYIICVVFLVVCVMTYIIGTYLSHVEKEFKVIGKKKMSEAYSSG